MKIQEKVELMGKIVTVSWTLKRNSDYGPGGVVKKWENVFHKAPRAGWIVGFRTIYSGKSAFIGPDEGYEWLIEKSHVCMLVTYWPSMKPIFVPLNYDGAYKLGGKPALLNYEHGGTWREEDKKHLREEMKDWPRDKKGRWIKR